MYGLDQFISQFDSLETQRAYRRDIERLFKHIKKEPQEITKMDTIDFLNHLKSKSLEGSTINRIISSIKSYFKFLLYSDIIMKNPFIGIKLPKKIRKEEEDLSDDEVNKMLAQVRSRRDLAIVCLMLFNGLRRSEVCNLSYTSIYKKNDTTVIEIIGKGSKVRIMPLNNDCTRAIIDYLEEERRMQSKGPIFLRQNGERLNGQTVYNIVIALARKAKIKKRVHPHMLRAKFASMALESGVPITSVQADLGHSSIETTSMYDHGKKRIERSSVLKIDTSGIVITDIKDED